MMSFLFIVFITTKAEWTASVKALDVRFISKCPTCTISSTSWSFRSYMNCTNEKTSVITLNPAAPPSSETIGIGAIPSKFIMNIDFYFYGDWVTDEYIRVYVGSIIEYIPFISPNPYLLDQGFCDSIQFSVQTIQLELAHSPNQYLALTSNSTNGIVGLRNIHFTYDPCYYKCKTCSGGGYDQCLSCYYGSPGAGICPDCPTTNPYFSNSYKTCVNYCVLGTMLSRIYECNAFAYSSLVDAITNQVYKRYWTEIYDQENTDTSLKQITCGSLTFGLFRGKAGAARTIQLPVRKHKLRIQINLLLAGSLQEDSGLTIRINNQYIASLFMYQSQLVTDGIKITASGIKNQVCSEFTSFTELNLELQDARPTGNGLFTITGNFTNLDFGWGIKYFWIASGVCVPGCVTCDNYNYCLGCSGSYRIYNGLCYSPCPLTTQPNSTHCYGFDEISTYSRYITKGFYNFISTPDINTMFDLVSFDGLNFQKGTGIFTSYTFTKRIFGGPFVWANASFTKTYDVIGPHYGIGVKFIVIFGEAFQADDGQFNYQFDGGIQQTMFINDTNCTHIQNIWGSDLLEYQCQIEQIIDHNTPTFNIFIECLGNNTNIIDRFCGISDYYVVQLNCQPFCDACTDSSTCQTWNATYTTDIKFAQVDCLANQYLDRYDYKCYDCPQYCTKCTDDLNCDECVNNMQLINRNCMCGLIQYLDSSQFCQDCVAPCISCRSETYCTSCNPEEFRELISGSCVCQTGFYEDINDNLCKQCHSLCTKCYGPSQYECNGCISLSNFQLHSTTCQCNEHYYYSSVGRSCQDCHSTCLTCSGPLSNNCLTCDAAINRELIGLTCQCQLGSYFDSTNCVPCPPIENISLAGCYKICGDGSQVWHNISCPVIICNVGFINNNNMCNANCGDGVVVAGEQCDDMNVVLFDGCFNCQYQCEEKCTTCNSLTPYPCPDTCGDSIISGTEVCDDGNDEQYDGCYQCEYQCQPQCTKCVQGVCYECNTYGWKVDTDLTCVENCGDNLVIGREQCDDYNTNPEDGCFNCYWQCRSNCLECNDLGNICLLCEPGFYGQAYYCLSRCGDGKVVSDNFNNEQCDDFNVTNFDGCSSTCQWQCQPATICTSCTSGKYCHACAQYYELVPAKNKCEETCGDNMIIGTENCEDLNNSMYDGCYKCRYQCSKYCASCSLGVCLTCKSGYQLNNYNYQCDPICGDKIVVNEEECDDGNLNTNDGCINCKLTCQQQCKICLFGKCYRCWEGFILTQTQQCMLYSHPTLIYEASVSQYLMYQFEEQIECKIYKFGYCDECVEGFFLNIFKTCQAIYSSDTPKLYILPDEISSQISNRFENHSQCNFQSQCEICRYDDTCQQCSYGWILDEVTQQCITICGDGIVGGLEECDSVQQNCVDCKLICDTGCIKCIRGYCEVCENGFIINEQKQCETFISCDSTMNGLSYTCQYCYQGVCLVCIEGWKTEKGLCTPVCGDGILIPGFEECDDGNDNYNDKCYNCLLTCPSTCHSCIEGKCICEGEGWVNDIQQGCIGNCGDRKVMGSEECDDGNNVEYDGCYNCRFSCHQQCSFCYQGVCKSCNYGYSLIEDKCQTICGDGQITDSEQCDDGNAYGQDGCSENCQIEQEWICYNFENKASGCEKIIPLKIDLELITVDYAFQIIQLSLNQQIKSFSQSQSVNFIQSKLLGYDQEQYNITLIPINEIQNEFTLIKYQLKIDFFKTMKNPELMVNLISNMIVTEQYIYVNGTSSIKLQNPKLMSQEEIQNAQLSSDTNKIILIVLMISGSIAILTNNLDMISNLLDILQILSYLSYINVTFPQNVQIYFNAFSLVSLTPIFEFLGFRQTISAIYEYPYLQTYGKFNVYEDNAYFISNTESIIISFVLGICIFQITTLIWKELSRVKYLPQNKRISLKLFQIFIQIRKYCFKLIIDYKQTLIDKFVMANAYDLLIACFLALNTKFIYQIDTLISLIFALTSLQLYGKYVLSKFGNQLLINKKWLLEKDPFYDGLNNKTNNVWVFQYNALLLIKKLLFCFILVYFQINGALQIKLLSLLFSIFALYLIILKPQSDFGESSKLLLTEILLGFSTIGMIPFCDEFQDLFSYEIQVQVGWFHIGMYSFILIYSTLMDFRKYVKIIKDFVFGSNIKQAQTIINRDPFISDIQ